MELIIFIGIPATGKSSYYKKYFYDSHIRINLDMLKTRHREALLIKACFDAKQALVVDNNNLTKELRKVYIDIAKGNKCSVKGYYFKSSIKSSLQFNETRENGKVPEVAICSAHKKLELPKIEEGFDELYYVSHDKEGNFETEIYDNEI